MNSQLTSDQVAGAYRVFEGYLGFWEHIKFKKGWAVPPFTRDQVEDVLREAAGIVVRIQTVLDQRNPGIKIRMLGGQAREYMHSFTDVPHDKEEFLRNIVHETFKDANGYIESNAHEIDAFFEEIRRLTKSAREAAAGKEKEKEKKSVEVERVVRPKELNKISEAQMEILKKRAAKSAKDESSNGPMLSLPAPTTYASATMSSAYAEKMLPKGTMAMNSDTSIKNQSGSKGDARKSGENPFEESQNPFADQGGSIAESNTLFTSAPVKVEKPVDVKPKQTVPAATSVLFPSNSSQTKKEETVSTDLFPFDSYSSNQKQSTINPFESYTPIASEAPKKQDPGNLQTSSSQKFDTLHQQSLEKTDLSQRSNLNQQSTLNLVSQSAKASDRPWYELNQEANAASKIQNAGTVSGKPFQAPDQAILGNSSAKLNSASSTKTSGDLNQNPFGQMDAYSSQSQKLQNGSNSGQPSQAISQPYGNQLNTNYPQPAQAQNSHQVQQVVPSNSAPVNPVAQAQNSAQVNPATQTAYSASDYMRAAQQYYAAAQQYYHVNPAAAAQYYAAAQQYYAAAQSLQSKQAEAVQQSNTLHAHNSAQQVNAAASDLKRLSLDNEKPKHDVQNHAQPASAAPGHASTSHKHKASESLFDFVAQKNSSALNSSSSVSGKSTSMDEVKSHESVQHQGSVQEQQYYQGHGQVAHQQHSQQRPQVSQQQQVASTPNAQASHYQQASNPQHNAQMAHYYQQAGYPQHAQYYQHTANPQVSAQMAYYQQAGNAQQMAAYAQSAQYQQYIQYQYAAAYAQNPQYAAAMYAQYQVAPSGQYAAYGQLQYGTPQSQQMQQHDNSRQNSQAQPHSSLPQQGKPKQ
jgi:hypothetical protein